MDNSKQHLITIFEIIYFIYNILNLVIALFFTYTINDFYVAISLIISYICFGIINLIISNTNSRFDNALGVMEIIIGYVCVFVVAMAVDELPQTNKDLFFSNVVSYSILILCSVTVVAFIVSIIKIIKYKKIIVQNNCSKIQKGVGIISIVIAIFMSAYFTSFI